MTRPVMRPSACTSCYLILPCRCNGRGNAKALFVGTCKHSRLPPLLGTYLAIVKAWTWTAETLQPVPHVPAPNPKPSTGVHASHTNQTGACVLSLSLSLCVCVCMCVCVFCDLPSLFSLPWHFPPITHTRSLHFSLHYPIPQPLLAVPLFVPCWPFRAWPRSTC